MKRESHPIEFREKFVAYIDVLGFSDRVKAAEISSSDALRDILTLLAHLGSSETRQKFSLDGPYICPMADRTRKDIDFQFTQISDCAIMSAEVSPAGVINLVSECCTVIIRLLRNGAMCRGYLTKGKVYHTETQVIGSGYMEAFKREGLVAVFKRETEDHGTPFVEVDPRVVEYVKSCGDKCVRTAFDRMTKGDGSSVALYPFKMFAQSALLSDQFGRRRDLRPERQSNENIRRLLLRWIQAIRQSVDPSHAKAMRKADHYIAAIEDQLKVCDAFDSMLDRLSEPYPSMK